MLKKMTMYWRVIACGLILILILNIAARFHSFCDWYVEHIFPVWVNTYGRFSDLFPFSFGECLSVVGLILVLIALVSGVLYIFLKEKMKLTCVVGIYFHQQFWGTGPRVWLLCADMIFVCLFFRDYMIFYKEKDGSLLLSWEVGAEWWNMMAGPTVAILCGSVFLL